MSGEGYFRRRESDDSPWSKATLVGKEGAKTLTELAAKDGYKHVVVTPPFQFLQCRTPGDWFDQLQGLPEPLLVVRIRVDKDKNSKMSGSGVWCPEGWLSGKELKKRKEARYRLAFEAAFTDGPKTIKDLREAMRDETTHSAPARSTVKKYLELCGYTEGVAGLWS